MKEIVAVLMAYGANPGIANYEGDLPSGLPPPSLVVRIVFKILFKDFMFVLNVLHVFHMYFFSTDGEDEKVQEGQLTFAHNGDNLN